MSVRDPYDDDGAPPIVYVRCMACGETVEEEWLLEHVAEDCDGVPLYEEL